MLKNYFKIAFRLINRHKTYAAINILGLSLGICSCIVIYLIIHFEFSFDNFYPDTERIYRVTGVEKTVNGEIFYQHNIPPPAPEIIYNEVSGFEIITAFYPLWAKINVRDTVNKIREYANSTEQDNGWWTGIILADSNYFKIFQTSWLAGNPVTALSEPFRVVLTDKRASDYFGNIPFEKILGREIIYNDSLHVRVSGIVKGRQGNTDLPFTDFISFATVNYNFLKNQFHTKDWDGNPGIWTFAKLSKSTSADALDRPLQSILKKYQKTDPLVKHLLHLQPLADMHFNADFRSDDFRKADKPTLYSLTLIAFFILTIATVNYINLSTAQSTQRAKEIGIRKVMGSSKLRLAFQILTETGTITCCATLIAVLMVKPVLLIFRRFIPPAIKFDHLTLTDILLLLGITVLTGLLAGIYPAYRYASYKPVRLLKGKNALAGGHGWLRKGLIVFQFIISMVLIIGAIVIAKQMNYVYKKDLGMKTDAVIAVSTPWRDSLSKVNILFEKLKEISGIANVAREIVSPIGNASFSMPLQYKGGHKKAGIILIRGGDENFIGLYQMRLLAGRNLRSNSPDELVINEIYSRELGFISPHDALEKLLYTDDQNSGIKGEHAFRIVGVVADFHEYSLHEAIKPTAIANIPQNEHQIAIKISNFGKNMHSMNKTISLIEMDWKSVYPDQPFNYSFLDESVARLYEKDQNTSTLINGSMIIAIFISCMGLFGLAMFTTQQKNKEIGIRKVLGAGTGDIIGMLNKDFVMLIIIALLIASPIAWIYMNQWLQNFVYHTGISWWIFLAAGFMAIFIALSTVGFHSIKAALANPVESLRTE